MKKYIAILLAALMVMALAACGQKTGGGSETQQGAENQTESENVAESNTETESSDPVEQGSAGKIAPAKDGTLTLSAKDIAVVVNGTAVPRPYNLKALEAAGVPADESRSTISLGAGDIFSANLYLDDNEDYVLIPAYVNNGESSVSITEAKADEIKMTTYADAPVDQGVSILGISFGMPRSEVKALIGEPSYDSGDYCEWHIEAPDIAYEGTLSMYFTEDADNGAVSEVDLNVFEK